MTVIRYANYVLRMRRECRECFPHHWLQRKPLVSDPGMHHGTFVTHMPWCMSGSLTRGGGKNVPGIPDACTAHNFAYLVRGSCWHLPTCVLPVPSRLLFTGSLSWVGCPSVPISWKSGKTGWRPPSLSKNESKQHSATNLPNYIDISMIVCRKCMLLPVHS